MEINITRLIETDLFPFSHSQAEGSENAGRETWKASQDHAATLQPPLLATPEELQATRDFALSSGGWNDEEASAWTTDHLNALFLQWVAGDTRECPALLAGIDFEERFSGMWYFQTPKDLENDMEDGPHESRTEAYRVASNELAGFNQIRRADSLAEIDWAEYEEMSRAGRVSSRLFRTDAGEIFFSLSE